MTSVPSGYIFMGAFMVWAIYRRIRRNIGQQPLKPVRIIVSIVILSLVSLMILATGLLNPMLAVAFAGGALVGVGGAFLGLRHTKFETTEQGHFYTPNTYIGVALSALLLGRMAYRMIMLQDVTQSDQPGHPPALQSPLTNFIIGLTIGYYLCYMIGLFRHTHDKR